MNETRTWKGIQANFALFQGEIISDPIFNGDYAFLTLRTSILQRDANSQIVELDQEIPLMVEPGGPINVVKNHIKTGRKLMAWCAYKSWEAQGAKQHSFVVKRFDLGDKPYEGPISSGTPPLPA
jgi:hypothetical protein